jgi:hypothetical protein
MTWFKVSDEFAFHPKVVAAGTSLSAWIRAASWSAQQLTDGFIPDHMVLAFGAKKDAARLVSVGLWDKVNGGYQFHDWADYQPLRAEIEEKRAKKQEAGRLGGVRSGQSRRSSKDEASASPDGSRSVHPAANPRPDPTSNASTPVPDQREPSVTRGTASPAERVVAEWAEASRAAGVAPIGDQTTTVGRLARELLAEGNDVDLVIDAARLAAAKGSVWIADLIGPAVAARREQAASVVSPDDPIWGATLGVVS